MPNKTLQIALYFVLVLCTTRISAQTILPTNTADVGFDTAPLGWTIVYGSTDVSNKDYWGGTIPWFIPMTDAPNGDTVWVSGIYNETVGTTISDLTIGVTYSLDFYIAESDQTATLSEFDGILKIEIGDESFLFPFVGELDFSWYLHNLEFVATAPEMLMTIEYAEYSSHTWNISFGSDLTIPCDTLITTYTADSVCYGEEITLSAISVNGGSVTWDGGIENDVPFIPPLGSNLYMANSDHEDDCGFGIEIIVDTVPEIDLAIDDEEICLGESATLSVDGMAEVFDWSYPGVEPDIPFTPEAGSYYIALTSSNGVCSTEDSVLINVYENPDVLASADDSTICFGEAFIFYGIGADEYDWDAPIEDGIAYYPEETGVAAFFVTGTNIVTGCSSEDYLYVEVLPPPEIIASADAEVICEGEEVILTGSGGVTMEWEEEIEDGLAFTPPLGTTTYIVVGYDLEGCSNSDTIDITVHPTPEITGAASESEICLGEPLTLTGSGGVSYDWSGDVIDGEEFIPESTGLIIYEVVGVDINGCENIATVEITIHEVPTITISADTDEICEGEHITLTAEGADEYEWTDGIINDEDYTPDGFGEFEYSVTGTNSETGCTNTVDILITVFENPSVTAHTTLDEICLGESIILSGEGASSYLWEDGIIDGESFTPPSLGTHLFTVTGMSDEGCVNTATIAVDVLDCEPVLAGFKMPNEVCVNDCITIMDTSLGNVIDWSWEFGPGIEPGTASVQNPTICLNEPGTYSITLNAVAFNGAESTYNQELLVHENPTIYVSSDTIIDLGGTANLFGTTLSEGDFLWSPENLVECSDCQITTSSPEETQTYNMMFIDENGCKVEDQILVMVNYRLSVGVPSAFSPNGDGNNDVLFVKGLALKSIYFTIYNRYGQQIFESTNQNIGWDGTFKNQEQNPGVFTWVLNYETLDGKSGKVKGNTTLIR